MTGPNAKAGAGAQGGMSLAQTALAFALAAVVAAGVGGLAGLQAPRSRGSADAAAGTGTSDGVGHAPAIETGSLELPPVVTNLAAPADVWVRIEGTLLFDGKTLPHGEALAGEISGDILAFMRTQTLTQIQGVAGLQHLRQDLNERVATRSEGRVRELIIKALVVQ